LSVAGFTALQNGAIRIITTIRRRSLVLGHVFAHKFAQHLRSRLVLRPADFQEFLAQIALNTYAKTGIFHRLRVHPMDTHLCKKYMDSRNG